MTALLIAMQEGDPAAQDRFIGLVNDELRKIATAKLRELGPARTLCPTELINETYVRLFGRETCSPWKDRTHFFCAAAVVMKNIIIDRARRRAARKRGGGVPHIPLDEACGSVEQNLEELLAIGEAIELLERDDAAAAKVVLLRFFGGLDHEQTAEAMGVSSATVRRDWAYAKAFIRQAISPDGAASRRETSRA